VTLVPARKRECDAVLRIQVVGRRSIQRSTLARKTLSFKMPIALHG